MTRAQTFRNVFRKADLKVGLYRHVAIAYVVPAIAVIALAAGCTRTAAQQTAPPPPQVTVASVIEREVTEWDEFTGRLQAVDSVEVRPRVSGLISAVRFDEGAMVHRGDLLFQIDARPFQAEVDRLRAELDRAKATAQRADSELQRAERLRTENAISREEYDRRAAFAQESSAQIAAVEATLRAAELNLEFTQVTSPIDGRVGRAIVTAGNLVSSGPGEATLLTTVVSLDPVYAYFDADEQIFLKYSGAGVRLKPDTTSPVRLKPDTTSPVRLKPDTTSPVRLKPDATSPSVRLKPDATPVRMALSSEEGFPRVGRLDFVDNQLDGARGTIRGRAVFRNSDGQLTPGLFVRLRLAGTASYKGLLIQDRAVGTDLSKKFVYVVGPRNDVQYRAVTLGPIVDGLRVVRSGLEAGESVIVNGLQRVQPGAQVTPVVEQMDHVS